MRQFRTIIVHLRKLATLIRRWRYIAYHNTFSHPAIHLNWNSKINPDSKLEGMNKIGGNTIFKGSMGLGSYIGHHCLITGHIGRFSSIGNHVTTNPGTHPLKSPFVTTSPCFYSLGKQSCETFATKQTFEEFRYAYPEEQLSINIGNDVWIGEGVFINGGVQIGDGAVVLPHAVVTKNVPPYTIVGGIPAKIIDQRFSPIEIEWLLKIQWWNNDYKWLKNNWELLNSFSALKQYYEK